MRSVFLYVVEGGLWIALSIFLYSLCIYIVRRKSKKGRGSVADDCNNTRMIQEMYQGFMRMEERIDTLETILMERDKVYTGRS